MKIRILITVTLTAILGAVNAQNYSAILGRPTDSTITISYLSDTATEVYWEYGTSPGNYSMNTPTANAVAKTPLEVVFRNLLPNTKYYYRLNYRNTGSAGSFQSAIEYSFQTHRPHGNNFTFAIEADPHLDSNSIPAAYALTIQNMAAKKPDFLIDLGDIFMSEKLPVKTQAEITKRHLLYRPYFNEVCQSSPLYLVIGNHEGELGWVANGSAASLPAMASNTRKLYYPNPIPNSFYSGDTIPENFVGLRGNYYSWEWGDALFIVLDPFWYSKSKGDWNYTLGKDQYDWFKRVLTASTAKYKFVFCHNLVGGYTSDARGGAEYADFFEMGGLNADSTYGFDANRPGWGKPIHTLMKENGVNIFFHGHDHFYGKQDKDNIVYLEVPQPSCSNIKNNQAAKYGYTSGTILSGRGYILVTVDADSVKSEYFRTYLPAEEDATHKNGELAASFSLAPTTSMNETIDESTFDLSQNYPNPFRGSTSISYKLSAASQVRLQVFDIFGRLISTLVDLQQKSGSYNVNFNACELALPAGIYYYKITIGNNSKTLKMICSN
jgi:hypothetical protein